MTGRDRPKSAHSAVHQQRHLVSLCVRACVSTRVCTCVSVCACHRTVEAASAVLVVNVLREAVLLEQLVGGVLELGQRLGRAADVAQGRGALGGASVGAEQGGGGGG